MTNPTTAPVDAIRGLIDERDRYEAWLSALEARRDATPAHVLDRVRTDYEGRLRGVSEQLVGQVVPLRDEEAALAGRQDELVRTLAERQDELAEVELRMLVGEFSAEDGERRVQETAAIVREVDGDRRGVSEQLEALRALLARAVGPAAEPAAEPAAAPPRGTPAGAAGDAAGAAGVATLGTDATAAEPAPADDAPAWPPAESREAPASAVNASGGWSSGAASGRGDDDTIVGTGDRLDSLAASLGGTVAQPPTSVGAGAGREKTLRCQLCGEMNYPTEWYCEQCGGELAAL